jgi:hypothetical protein
LAWLVPLFVLWSNLHGGVLGGFGTLGLAAAGWTIAWAALRRPARWSSAFRLSRDLSRHTLKRELQRPAPIRSLREAAIVWLCVAGCGLALLATPYGTGSLEAWLAIMSMSLPDLIIEHAPLDPRTPPGILAILLFVIFTGVFAATPRGRWRVTFWLPVVWFVLTCLRIRHAPLFAMLAGIALADLVPQSRLAAWLVRRGWLRAPLRVAAKQGLRVAAKQDCASRLNKDCASRLNKDCASRLNKDCASRLNKNCASRQDGRWGCLPRPC